MSFVIGALALDLGVFHREPHAVSRREALTWCTVWISLALAFNAGVYYFMGFQSGLQWTTGYVLEQSLSIDNVFVFLLIFTAFRVPPQYQHRVLFWGILGAIIMRAIMILFAGFLLDTLHWMIYVFGAFLILTGLRFLRESDEEPDLERNRLLLFAKRLMPVTKTYEGQKFFVKHNGVRMMTPLFLVLLLVESSDLLFAVDSIPAIYAVTNDRFIIYTSNIFAILGLRSLYFVFAGYLSNLLYLKPALAIILTFVGTKMLLVDTYHVPPQFSLGVIISVLSIAIILSVRKARAEGLLGTTPPPPTPVYATGSLANLEEQVQRDRNDQDDRS
jgi:tellurite resistance protein TerC